jgi:DNA-binding protein H-NS
MSINLKGLSLTELKSLSARIDKAIARTEKQQKKQALVAVEKLAKAHGLELSDLVGQPVDPKKQAKAKTPKKAPSKPMYRNPADPKQTWTGKGRRPGWYVAAIEAGTAEKDLLI